MEAAPALPTFETVPEVDLLEVFREKEVTIFGVPGTFGDLAEMCPIDLQAEHISLETKNEFVVKAANEAGLEIGREYEAVFTKYIEQNKLERKVTFVANQPVEQVSDKQAAPEQTAPRQPRKEIAAPSDIEPSEFRPSREPKAEVLAMQQVLAAANKIEPAPERTEKPLKAKETRPPETVQQPQFVRKETVQSNKQAESILSTHTRPVEIIGTTEASPVETFSESLDSLTAEAVELALPQPLYPDEVVLLAGDYEPIYEESETAQEPLTETRDTAAYYRAQEKVVVETESVLLPGELPAPPEEAAAMLEELALVLETAEPQQLQKFEAILEAIMQLPEQLDMGIPEHAPIIEEKLQVLFIELFEEAGIDYTPELIDSFVLLTQNHFFGKVLRVNPEMEKSAQLPDQIGTREFLQALQHGLSRMRQAVFHIYEIGKSVLRLYGQGGATQLAA